MMHKRSVYERMLQVGKPRSVACCQSVSALGYFLPHARACTLRTGTLPIFAVELQPPSIVAAEGWRLCCERLWGTWLAGPVYAASNKQPVYSSAALASTNSIVLMW